MAEEMLLVCATIPTQPESLAAVCTKCNITVYGTRGKLDNPEVAGVMHHGKMLNAGEIQSFVEDWFAKVMRHGRN
jgi:hypothetical protein